MSNTPVMDSPDVLRHALHHHVPDMRNGFTIQTRHGDIYVTADDAAPFADAMEYLLMRKTRQIQYEPDMQARVEQLLREATRSDGKCLLSREEAFQMLQTTSASRTASSELQASELTHQHACFAQRDCNRHRPVSTEVQDDVTPRDVHEPSLLADQALQEKHPSTSRLRVHSFCLIVPLDTYCLSLVPHLHSEEEKSKYHKKQGQ
ncbi:hypothetical protein DUT67_14720 [Pectobacterium peruviense]|uniref:hypothetical protein n=1 Tax=Pectobacterium peruviense TaxID=2066479 RepID=UPI000DE25025|nr:hypothetical protein [Pectobacterium peruviense]